MPFLLTPLRVGRRYRPRLHPAQDQISTHAPAGGATIRQKDFARRWLYFYSRPCGRGDVRRNVVILVFSRISTHAPAGGATRANCKRRSPPSYFYSRPCGRGDRRGPSCRQSWAGYFYSRPCGRGDATYESGSATACDFYSRPCGRGDTWRCRHRSAAAKFLLTPLREGRQILAVNER